MDFRADLHVHSYLSDGTLSPEEILHLAKEKNLKAIAITDHDTIDAYTLELFQLAKELQINLISGVEVSSDFEGQSIHVLGYNFDVNSKSLKNFLTEVQEKRKLRNIKIIEKLNEKKIDISLEELYEFAKSLGVNETIVGRIHIANLMKKKGYIKTIQGGFDNYVHDEGPCFVKGFKFSSKEVIDAIHSANGKVVLAHPNVIRNKKIIKNLLKLGFDGIEVYYARLPLHIEMRWKRLAQQNNLLTTGGSDFHGQNRPYITLGCSWIDEESFNKLID